MIDAVNDIHKISASSLEIAKRFSQQAIKPSTDASYEELENIFVSFVLTLRDIFNSKFNEEDPSDNEQVYKNMEEERKILNEYTYKLSMEMQRLNIPTFFIENSFSCFNDSPFILYLDKDNNYKIIDLDSGLDAARRQTSRNPVTLENFMRLPVTLKN